MIKNYDFAFEGRPEHVGMKTGATIHTMNGLNMRATKVDANASPPSPEGYWEQQHLKRGLSASGRPFKSTEAVASQDAPEKPRPDDPGIAATP